MNQGVHPILYSFRRCPYAMRARMALYVSGQVCTHREVVLRDKPVEMTSISAKATVPVLEIAPGKVLEESFEIMLWALEQNDPLDWLSPDIGTTDDMTALVRLCETDLKPHLDRYKYSNRYDNTDPLVHRAEAEIFIQNLNNRLEERDYLFGNRPSVTDFAIAPFIRQFANTDRSWFDATPYPALKTWLAWFLDNDIFLGIMTKFDPWKPGDPLIHSPHFLPQPLPTTATS
jgi:glutathione S-transferase